eukprot:jgi/Tetstr1/465480/TSEL_010164.t1
MGAGSAGCGVAQYGAKTTQSPLRDILDMSECTGMVFGTFSEDYQQRRAPARDRRTEGLSTPRTGGAPLLPGQQARKQTQKRATTSGLPIPVIGFIFTPFTVALLYFAAAVRFWWNYQRTVYSSALVTRVTLTALWPVLLIISSTYRTNFSKAWKGN